MRKKPPINEFEKRPPNSTEVRKAIKLAKRVSPKLAALMEATEKRKNGNN